MKKILLILILVLFSVSASASGMEDPQGSVAEGQKKIALLPFDNITMESSALIRVMPKIRQRLENLGFGVITEDDIANFLCERRLRANSYVSTDIAQAVGRELGAGMIMAGSIVSYKAGEMPKIGIIARLIDSSTGTIIWADYISVSGEDYTVILGLGTVKKMEVLIPKALDKLFASFSTVPIRKDMESLYRIAVMPLKNKSEFQGAGIIATHMFIVELLNNPKFEPVEYGEIKKLCLEFRIRSKGELEYRNIESLSKALGTYGILLGSVDEYSEGTRSSSIPKIGVSARLLDARKNKILWYNSLQLSGEGDTVAFGLGRIRQVDKLAYKAVSELVRRMEKIKWH